MSPTNNFMNSFVYALLCSCFLLGGRLHATEHAKHAFGLNVAAGDAETLRVALDEILKDRILAGSVPGPFETKWTFGMFRIRNISYSFDSSVPELALTDSGIKLTARLRHFTGSVGRIDLNAAGTRYCENIPASSLSKDIDVEITLNGDVDNDGNFRLRVVSSHVTLDKKNFKIAKAGKCSALWGFNWAIRRALPKIAQHYQNLISEKLGVAIAKRLEDTGIQYSPYLFMNITLPVNHQPIKPFYARLSLMPQDITIQKSHFSAWFGSDIEFDPDFDAGLLQIEPSPDWPLSRSHIAISWEFLDAMFKEANVKGLVAGELTKFTVLDGFFYTKIWDAVWPGLSQLEGVGQEVTYELDGATSLKWSRASNTGLAQLAMHGMRIKISSGNLLIATLLIDGRLNISLDVTSKDNSTFAATIDSLIIDSVTVNPDEGLVAGRPWSGDAMKQIADSVQKQFKNTPASSRRLIHFQTPQLHIGARDIRLARAELFTKGLAFPVTIEPARNVP